MVHLGPHSLGQALDDDMLVYFIVTAGGVYIGQFLISAKLVAEKP